MAIIFNAGEAELGRNEAQGCCNDWIWEGRLTEGGIVNRSYAPRAFLESGLGENCRIGNVEEERLEEEATSQ